MDALETALGVGVGEVGIRYGVEQVAGLLVGEELVGETRQRRLLGRPCRRATVGHRHLLVSVEHPAGVGEIG